MSKSTLRRISQDLWEEIEKESQKKRSEDLRISKVQASHLVAMRLKGKVRIKKPKRKWRKGDILESF